MFQCVPGKCPIHGGIGHCPPPPRSSSNRGNTKAGKRNRRPSRRDIPLALAEEVAEIVQAIFVLDGIRRFDAAAIVSTP